MLWILLDRALLAKELTAPHSSNLTIVVVFKGAILDLAKKP